MSKMWIRTYVQTYSILTVIGFSLLVSSAKRPCPAGCSTCETLPHTSYVIRAVCSGELPSALPTTVRELQMTNVPFPSVLTPDSFENKTDLTLLEVTNSTSFSVIWDKAFSICSKLNNLIIENTTLVQIGEFTFWGLVGLETLSLKHNQLMAIDQAFLHVTNLKYLYLEQNQLHKITSDMFTGLTKLYELRLQGNLIDHIEPRAFSDLTSLNQLVLGKNHIKVIDSGMFSGLSNVRKLDIKDNEISQIQADAFTGTSLDQLDLEGNKLTDFPSNSFKNLTDIPKQISIKKNLIRVLDNFVFQGVTSQILDLSGNNISHVGRKAFDGCHMLKVMLDNNNISTLSSEIKLFWRKAIALTIGGNPWQCDCDLMWMVEFVSASSPRKYKARAQDPMPSCVGISKYANKPFDKVKSELESDCITTTTDRVTSTTKTSTETTTTQTTTVTESDTTTTSPRSSSTTQTTTTTTKATTPSTTAPSTTTLPSTTDETPQVKPSQSNGLSPGLWIGLAVLAMLVIAGFAFWFLFGKNKLQKSKVKPGEKQNRIPSMVAPSMIQVQAPASTAMPNFSSSKKKIAESISEEANDPNLKLHNSRTLQTTSLA